MVFVLQMLGSVMRQLKEIIEKSHCKKHNIVRENERILDAKKDLIYIVRSIVITSLLAISAASCGGPTLRSDPVLDFIPSPAGTVLGYSLPKGVIEVKIENGTNSAPLKITTTTEHVADPGGRYWVALQPSLLAHDKFVIEVNKKGLLSSAKSDNVDKIAEIAKVITQIATESAKIGAGFRSASMSNWVEDRISIDPFAPTPRGSSHKRRGGALDPLHARVRYSGRVSGAAISVTQPDGSPLPHYTRQQIEAAAQQCAGSLCSRFLRPVKIAVHVPGISHSEAVVLVPDPVAVISHDIRRSACVSRVSELKFEDGILTKFDLNKPSEIEGCLKVPLEVVKEVAALPLAVLTYQSDLLQKEKSVIDAERAAFESEKLRLDALAKLIDQQAIVAAQRRPEQGDDRNLQGGTPLTTADIDNIESRCSSKPTPAEQDTCRAAIDACRRKGGLIDACLATQ